MRGQLLCHVFAYAEMLLAWQLPEKRGELLKLVEDDIQKLSTDVVVSDETLYSAQMGKLICAMLINSISDNLVRRLPPALRRLWPS